MKLVRISTRQAWLVVTLMMTVPVLPAQAADEVTAVIGRGHITMGGLAATADGYLIGGTIGQASQPLICSDTSFLVSIGFWYPTGAGILTDVSPPAEAFQNALFGNFPNPFNPSTTVKYSLATRSEVDIDIFDLRGRLITTIREGEKPAGIHSVVWGGRDARNQAVGSGIYFIRIRAGEFQDVSKATLIK